MSKQDVLEACEMLRASITLMRQSFGITFMSRQVAGYDISDDDMKAFAHKFDDVQKVFGGSYESLYKKAQTLE